MKIYDTIIIGAGQSGLSVAYYLRRSKNDYIILDDQNEPGGSWHQTWDGLKLFSPREYSSLSGWQMPMTEGEYPTKNELIHYLIEYEKKYQFPIQRNTKVVEITKINTLFHIKTDKGLYYAKTLVSATGNAKNPFIPEYKHQNLYKGKQIHSIEYKNAQSYKHLKVLIVGGGNSGAQILAEVSKVTKTKWVTLSPPNFLPDDVDGRYLFIDATKRFYELQQGIKSKMKQSLADIVMIKSVKEAKRRGVLNAVRPFKCFYEKGVIWENEEKEIFDIVIWCTGFKPYLNHLEKLDIISHHQIKTIGTKSIKIPELWLVGYGNWTGYASATLYGVGKTAKITASEIQESLKQQKGYSSE